MSIDSLNNAVNKLWNLLNTNKDGTIDNNDNIDEAIKNELGINNGKAYSYGDLEQSLDNILETVLNNTRDKYFKGEITKEEYSEVKGISAEIPESNYIGNYTLNINHNLSSLSEFKSLWEEKKQACSNEEDSQKCEADFKLAKKDLIAKQKKSLKEQESILNAFENTINMAKQQKEDYIKKYPDEYIDTLIEGYDKLIINVEKDMENAQGIFDEITDYIDIIENVHFSDL